MRTAFSFALLLSLFSQGESIHLRENNNLHDFLNLDNINPFQTLGLISGDATAILPNEVRGITQNLLNTGGGTPDISQFTNTGSTGGLLGLDFPSFSFHNEGVANKN